MPQALPVISTKGAPWSGLEDNRCGLWVDHGVEPMKAALRIMMSLSVDQRASMGKRGRDWMLRDFSGGVLREHSIKLIHGFVMEALHLNPFSLTNLPLLLLDSPFSDRV